MQKDLTQQFFKYSGKEYFFQAIMYVKTNDKQELTKDDESIQLENDELESFVYESKLNDLCLRGKLVYTDHYGKIDRLIEKQYPYCQVYFCRNEQARDGDVEITKLSEEEYFQHTFLIDGIKILNRMDTRITYEFSLISLNWFRLFANVDYSNYDKEAESIFCIIKALLQKQGLQIDSKTFDLVKTDVKLQYITTANDNLISVVKYLLHKLYYRDNFDDSLKYVVYDETDDKFGLFDIKNKESNRGTYSVVVSMMKSNTEAMTEQEPNNFGMIYQCPREKSIHMIFDDKFYDFDMSKNCFIDRSIESKNIIKYYNTRVSSCSYDDKRIELPQNGLTYKNDGAFWNNDFGVYNDIVDSLNKDNTLIVNTSGHILRKIACYIQLAIDRRIKNDGDDTRDMMKNELERYKGFEGLWIVSKVENIIEPAKRKYRQNLWLMRNFVVKKTDDALGQGSNSGSNPK